MNCPLCGGASRRCFERHGYFIRDCGACGHRFAELTPADDHVRTVYSDRYFNGGGAGYSGYLKEGPMLRDYGRWYAELLARSMQPGRVLDVGCAAGFWLAGLADRGWEVQGIEPNAGMAAYAREQLRLDVRTATIEELDPARAFDPTLNHAEVPAPINPAKSAGPFDVIAMIQVSAHFRDPRRALRSAHSLLHSDGFLLLETWDRNHWTSRALGRRWHEYTPPSVLHWFSRESLRRLGAECGFDFVAAGRPRKRIAVAHALTLFHHKYTNAFLRGGVAVARAAVPGTISIPYPLGDLFWMLLRRSRQS